MESAAVKVRVPTKSCMMARSSPKAANLPTKNNIRSGCVQRPLPAKHLQYLHRSNTAACRQCRPHKRLRRRRPSCIVPVQVLASFRPCLRRSNTAARRPSLHRSSTAAPQWWQLPRRLRRRRPSCIVPVQVLASFRPCLRRSNTAARRPSLHRSSTAAPQWWQLPRRLRRRRPSCIVPVQVLALARPCLHRSSIAALRPWQILSRQGVGLGHSLPPVLQRAGRLRLQAAPRLNLQCHPELPAIPLRHRHSRRMSRRNRLNRPTLQCLPPPLQSRLNRPRVLCQAPILPSYPVITHP